MIPITRGPEGALIELSHLMPSEVFEVRENRTVLGGIKVVLESWLPTWLGGRPPFIAV